MVSGRLEPVRKEQRLRGLTFVLTGTLLSTSRDQARRAIVAQGGRVTGALSKKTSYLVVGEDPGSKLQQAAALGVETLDEQVFAKLIMTERSETESR
ncbi:MAG: BRCT domain-containing protein [Acidobacteriota bacterium]|nr:BRCT domain-containing protein [Acidobacteriota bacterium]